MRRSAGFWVALGIVILGALVRLLDVGRPFDYRLGEPWRESDYLQIARNFYREGMSIFYPRIDWRGDTPGFVESEFPLIPWTAACWYHIFGEEPRILRLITAVLQIGCLLVFLGLSRRLLAPPGSWFAAAAFALNPALIALAPSTQPESLMLLCGLVAVLLLLLWEDRPTPGLLLLACLALAAGILAKANAAHLGMVFAFVVLRRLGLRALADPWVYLGVFVALAPAIAWQLWANHFWVEYGNSLGLSNESHFLGTDMLWPPRFLLRLFWLDTVKAFSPLGWLLALVAVWRSRDQIAVPLVWYGTVWVLYIVAARTTADSWAHYYHAVAVPPACLLMGAGLNSLVKSKPSDVRSTSEPARRALGALLAGSVLLSLAALDVRSFIHRRESWHEELFDLYGCIRGFEAHIPADAMIVTAGGAAFDENGKPVAHNRPMVFAWLDRKGFTYAVEDFSLQTLDRILKRGGRFWVAEQAEVGQLRLTPGSARWNRPLATCDSGYALYDLAANIDQEGRPGT